MSRAVLVCAAIAAVAIVGCGGGGADSTTATPGKAEYIARADAICRTYQAKRERLESRVADLGAITANETHEVAALLRRAADDLTVEITRLRALRPPAADTRTRASLLSFLRDQVAHLDGWARAYDEGSEGKIRAFQTRIAEDSSRAAAVARHYGFKVCGGSGSGNTGNLTRFR